MRWHGIIPRLLAWLRRYCIAFLLIGALSAAMIQVYTVGTPPVPQQPPEGLIEVRKRVSLQWNRGTREEPITLQVSIDDPTFAAPILERTVNGTTHTMSKLEGGHTYYWRLVQGGKPGPAASFVVSRYNANL